MHSSAFPLRASASASVLDDDDVLEQLRRADHADRTLLYLVACAMLATLALAATVSMLS